MRKRSPSRSEMLKGILDMTILRTLADGDTHGHTISKVIECTSEDLLEVTQGLVYPALSHPIDLMMGERGGRR